MTTDRSKRRVRWTAISATALMGVGAAAAIAADPFPRSQQPKDPAVQALEAREKALAAEATRVNAMNAERWATYRTQLEARQMEIARVNDLNAASSSYSAPQATYVPSAPVASSSSS
jgi:hypothetical protein